MADVKLEWNNLSWFYPAVGVVYAAESLNLVYANDQSSQRDYLMYFHELKKEALKIEDLVGLDPLNN